MICLFCKVNTNIHFYLFQILQVTQSKTDLEKALRYSKKVKKDHATLDEFISTTKITVEKQRDVSTPRNLEEDLQNIQVFEKFNLKLVSMKKYFVNELG